MSMRSFNRKRRKYLDGALYSNIFSDSSRVINLSPGEILNLHIKTENNIFSKIRIFVEKNKDHVHLQNCQRLANILSKYRANTSRSQCCDRGNMYIVGTGSKANNDIGLYELTKRKKIQSAISKLVQTAENYYRDNGLGVTVDQIKSNKCHSCHECMNNSFVSSITSSYNYVNASHLDVDDACEGIVTWTTEDKTKIEGWYFVLPNVSIDGYRGTIIQLKHGITIKIDARIIVHCSSGSRRSESHKRYGTYFGCSIK